MQIWLEYTEDKAPLQFVEAGWNNRHIVWDICRVNIK